jgi:hypothetical protein
MASTVAGWLSTSRPKLLQGAWLWPRDTSAKSGCIGRCRGDVSTADSRRPPGCLSSHRFGNIHVSTSYGGQFRTSRYLSEWKASQSLTSLRRSTAADSLAGCPTAQTDRSRQSHRMQRGQVRQGLPARSHAQSPPSEGSAGGSNSCTPRRPHWRRDHWYTVLHGEKRQSRWMQWFQPVYMGLS